MYLFLFAFVCDPQAREFVSDAMHDWLATNDPEIVHGRAGTSSGSGSGSSRNANTNTQEQRGGTYAYYVNLLVEDREGWLSTALLMFFWCWYKCVYLRSSASTTWPACTVVARGVKFLPPCFASLN